MFTKTGIQELFRPSHPIQVEVDKSYHAICKLYRIRLGQRVSRTFYPPGIAGRVQQGARKRSLTGTQIAMQMERQAGRQHPRQRRAQCDGAGLVLQMGMVGLHDNVDLSLFEFD